MNFFRVLWDGPDDPDGNVQHIAEHGLDVEAMTQKKFERVMRTRKLTPEEVARDREIRKAVEAEFPPVESPPGTGPHRLSQALKIAIRRSGKSVDQLAEEAGVSPLVISRFLSGERDIRLATADRLAEALGLVLPAG